MSNQSSSEQQVRLDKWLWAARFFKTRGLARTAVQAGKVQYNGQRTKPAKVVELDAIIVVPRGNDRMTVNVTGLSEHRGNATKAAELYQESAASLAKREENAAARKANALYNPHPEQRPNSKQRRELIKFKNQ